MNSLRSQFVSTTRQLVRCTIPKRPTILAQTRTLRTNINTLYRIERKETGQYSSNPYTESMRHIKSQAKFVAKITGCTVVALAASAALVWQAYHLYIEWYLESTPTELGYQARNLLHGAYVREKVSPDYEVAAVYVREVLRLALEVEKLEETSPCVIALRLRLANDEAHAGNLLDAIAEYNRAWHLLLEQKKAEDGKVTEAREMLLAQTAKHMGDLYLRVADYAYAEEFLAWTLHVVGKTEKSQETKEIWDHLKVTTTCSLGSVYAVQGNFGLALPLFLQALKAIPESEKENTKWICLKAILQNQLAETMFGLGKLDDAMGWAQASFESCSTGYSFENPSENNEKDSKDCKECGAVVSNNLGSLLELKGQFDQAAIYYKQAMAYASALEDNEGYKQYSENELRVEKKESEAPVTTVKAVIEAKEPVTEPVQENKSSWSSWLKRK
ncbi:hypothetical protein J3Q64DRAFT_1685261 [Phycomyces blakesleeanus]|uniref:Uncharacterized protein n=2 Tax=Phycomyces blakesleeanus TaxID=4837 RepID=A0A163EJN1_PHYB8|nr:hypothetical protein PHYBLDRAFT_62281 [Phycomyces blakesleeanus NRRL 1555(-)]OAD78950.1 hypothetical protein PHYBLDRAFT_62281 [Phycomyces blakesleeanus NRRL 1555(-)]|eukprot:XP_018296990.1 hypothetical protein PHYBLDRAFT_62281 [Phycomyces blakesleeanus NRRL 1555(-)]